MEMIYFVTYDLHQHGRDYPAVAAVLDGAESAINPMGSVWFIQTIASAIEVRNALMAAGDDNDEHFVSQIPYQGWASFNLNEEALQWFGDPARRW